MPDSNERLVRVLERMADILQQQTQAIRDLTVETRAGTAATKALAEAMREDAEDEHPFHDLSQRDDLLVDPGTASAQVRYAGDWGNASSQGANPQDIPPHL